MIQIGLLLYFGLFMYFKEGICVVISILECAPIKLLQEKTGTLYDYKLLQNCKTGLWNQTKASIGYLPWVNEPSVVAISTVWERKKEISFSKSSIYKNLNRQLEDTVKRQAH